MKIYKVLIQIFIGYSFYIIIKFNEIKNNLTYKLKIELNDKIINYIYNESIFYNKSKKSLDEMKKVIYTINLGGYDKVNSFNKEKGFDYYIFCDRYDENNNTNWTFLPIPKYIKDANISIVKKQRFIKLNPHLFFKNYDLSIYLDATFIIFGNLNEFLFRILSPKFNIYTFEHPKRDCLYDEIVEVIHLQKEKESIGNLLKTRYRKEQFPYKNGLIESSINYYINHLKLINHNKV